MAPMEELIILQLSAQVAIVNHVDHTAKFTNNVIKVTQKAA